METKVCKRCGKELPLSEFYDVPSMTSGKDNTCKNCRREMKTGKRIADTLFCPVCERQLPYYKFLPSKRGDTGRMWCCKECYDNKPNMSDNNFRKTYDEEFKKLIYRQKRESRIRNFTHAMYIAAKNRARRRGIEFNIEESDIVIPDICPLLEIPIEYGTRANYDRSPSLDRIDNNKGYIKGNVWVISQKANAMKNSATFEELKTFSKNILRYSPSYTENEGIEQENKESLG